MAFELVNVKTEVHSSDNDSIDSDDTLKATEAGEAEGTERVVLPVSTAHDMSSIKIEAAGELDNSVDPGSLTTDVPDVSMEDVDSILPAPVEDPLGAAGDMDSKTVKKLWISSASESISSTIQQVASIPPGKGFKGKNQFMLDFPEGVSGRGTPGSYSYRENDIAYETEQSQPMGTRNVPPCRLGIFETEFNSLRAFQHRRISIPGVGRRGKTGQFGLRDSDADAISGVVAYDRDEDIEWSSLPMTADESAQDGSLAGLSLHAILDRCYNEPNSQERSRKLETFRDKYPGVYYDYHGTDVTGIVTPKLPERPSRTRRCHVQ